MSQAARLMTVHMRRCGSQMLLFRADARCARLYGRRPATIDVKSRQNRRNWCVKRGCNQVATIERYKSQKAVAMQENPAGSEYCPPHNWSYNARVLKAWRSVDNGFCKAQETCLMRVEFAYAVSIAAAVVTFATGSNNSDDVAGKGAMSATAAPVDGMTAGTTVVVPSRAAAPFRDGVHEGPDNESSAQMAVRGVGARDIRIGGHGDRLIRNTRFAALRLSSGIHVAVTSSSRAGLPQLQAVRLAANDAASAERAILRNTTSVPRDTAMLRETSAAVEQMAARVAVPSTARLAHDRVRTDSSVFALDDFKGSGQAVLGVAKL